MAPPLNGFEPRGAGAFQPVGSKFTESLVSGLEPQGSKGVTVAIGELVFKTRIYFSRQRCM